MFSRRAQHSSAGDARQRAAAAGHPAGSALLGGEPPSYSDSDRSCCCPAKPQVKVIMPPTLGRPHPTDLWLCGHHYRHSRTALDAAGATVIDLTRAPAAV
jgi:hypothetical protein